MLNINSHRSGFVIEVDDHAVLNFTRIHAGPRVQESTVPSGLFNFASRSPALRFRSVPVWFTVAAPQLKDPNFGGLRRAYAPQTKS
jgi:hypothetical protein